MGETLIVDRQRKTLLIVDDEPKICEMLSRFFSSRGFRIVTATSGQRAIEILTHEPPDYLLLDIRMPDVSGLDVLKMAKSYCPNVKVVMVTAIDDQEVADTAFRLGATDYITKPFELDETSWARAFFADDTPAPPPVEPW